jgi:DNA polymerase-1
MIGFVTEDPAVIRNLKLKPEDNIVFCTKEQALSLLQTKDTLGFDSETLGFDPYTTDLITIQLGNDVHQFVIDVKSVDIQFFKELLETKELIGHNLKFDLKFLYHERIIPYKVYDTFLGEKTTRLGIDSHRCSLDACVYRHLGIVLDKTERKNINGKFTPSFILYSALDVAYLHKLKEIQLGILEKQGSLKSIELDNRFVKVLAYIEYCGIKLDEDKWRIKMGKTKLDLDKAEAELNEFVLENKMVKFIERQLDMFNTQVKASVNWNSSQQVVEFFKALGVDTKVVEKGVEKDTIEASHLGKFAKEFPIIGNYLNYKQAQKDLGTYGENWIRLINPVSGRIHTQYKQLMNTGRLSSGGRNKETGEAYPNLQNIPSDEETRSCFVAENGNVIIGCDYTGQEQIVLVNKCLDANLLEFYDKNLGDMHSFVASKMYDELDGMDLDEIKKKHKDKRQSAKVAGFAINYGGSGIGIADQLGLSVEQGQKIYDAYFAAFPGLKAYFDEAKKFGVDNGYVLISAVTGKKSYVDYYDEFLEAKKAVGVKGFWDNYKKHREHKTASYSKIKQQVSTFFSKKGQIERMSLNYPIQGESAEITKLSCVYFWEDYLLPNNLLFTVKFINTVHDENLVECPESLSGEIANALESAMVKAGAVFCKRVPLKADPCIEKFWKK